MISPYSEKGICSRCHTCDIATWYHVCEKCADKAQEEYRKEVKALTDQEVPNMKTAHTPPPKRGNDSNG